jgi:site-specific DNA recombinase
MNESRRKTPETIPPRRCAIYTRVAVGDDPLNPNSLQAQEEICRTLIDCRTFDATAEAKWIHTGTYADSSCSGATLQRPALERLLADAAAGKFDVVVTSHIDRVSRSISHVHEVLKHLEEHNVDFASVTPNFDTSTPKGKLILDLVRQLAADEEPTTPLPLPDASGTSIDLSEDAA